MQAMIRAVPSIANARRHQLCIQTSNPSVLHSTRLLSLWRIDEAESFCRTFNSRRWTQID